MPYATPAINKIATPPSIGSPGGLGGLLGGGTICASTKVEKANDKISEKTILFFMMRFNVCYRYKRSPFIQSYFILNWYQNKIKLFVDPPGLEPGTL